MTVKSLEINFGNNLAIFRGFCIRRLLQFEYLIYLLNSYIFLFLAVPVTKIPLKLVAYL